MAEDIEKLFSLYNARVIRRSGCWGWAGGKFSTGYGCVGRSTLAHRCSWQAFRGPIPKGMHVLHKCDNTECSNPDHLFLGTAKDNAQDKVKKGRHRYPDGRDKGARLSADLVRDIRRARNAGMKGIAVAKKFGVSQGTVSMIARRLIHTGVSD